MSDGHVRWRPLIVCLALVGVGAAATIWLVPERNGQSREAELQVMRPDVVGNPPTVEWRESLICQGEKLAVACLPSAGAGSGDRFYLETTINLRQHGPTIGVVNLLSSFLGYDTHAIICPPPARDGSLRCAAMPTDASPETTAYLATFDLPIESAVYIR